MAALACGALLAACAEDESKGDDVEALLDRAFRRPIERADLSIDAYLRVDGLEGFERPIRLHAAGSYIGDRGAPQLDLDLNLGAQGAGQTVQFGLLRTADRAFVKFGGEFYEQPRREVRRANRELGAARGRRAGSLRDFGLAPRTWIAAARDEGEEKVAGVSTRHVSASLDPRRVLGDLNRLVGRSASAIGGSAGAVPAALPGEQLDDLAEMVRNPSFDVYVGKEDEVIRRLSAQLEVRVPEEGRTSAAGIEAGALRFSIEFRDVGGDQLIQAPARSRPIADLTRQLRGLSALGGLGALEGAARGDRRGDRTPERPRGGPADADPGSSPDGEDGVEAFRRYADCLDRARLEDTEALSRCRELLR